MTLKTRIRRLRFIWRDETDFGGDLARPFFAVLLGGAVALLSCLRARDSAYRPLGLGLLRAAPGVGASIMAVAAGRTGRLRGRAGITLLWSGRGIRHLHHSVRNIRSLVWSLAGMCFLLGASDNDQRHHPRNLGSAPYARRNARTGHRRRYDFHRHLE